MGGFCSSCHLDVGTMSGGLLSGEDCVWGDFVLLCSIRHRSQHQWTKSIVQISITFMTLLLTFNCLHGLAPLYLPALRSPYCPTCSLRSSDKLLLKQPTSCTKIGERAFSCAAPRVWNELPITVHQYMMLGGSRWL